MEVEAVTHALRWFASRGDSQTIHAIILTDSMSLIQKVKIWEAQTGMFQWSTSTFENFCGCTALDMPEWREMSSGNDQLDWRAKRPSQVACVSEDLKCWGAWDPTCTKSQRRITPSIAWRREAWKEEVLDDLPWKDERARAIVSQTNIGTVSKATLGNFWETVWST